MRKNLMKPKKRKVLTAAERAERKAKRAIEKEARIQQQLEDLLKGIGWSSDRVLARYFSVTRQTIWDWSRQGKLPKPKKISANRTRWNNKEIKAHDEAVNNLQGKELLGSLYG